MPSLHWGQDRLSADFSGSVSSALLSWVMAWRWPLHGGEGLAAVAVGEQAEVADLDEAGGQNVKQEAADELGCIEAHDAAPVVVPRIAPAKAHLAVLQAEQPTVGDGDAMGVAGQVLEHMFGTAEGRLGVDYPLLAAQADSRE